MTANKSSKIVTVNELVERSDRLKGLLSAAPKTTAVAPASNKSALKQHKEYIANLNYKRNIRVQLVDYANLPTEILYIVFTRLNFDDLITCTQVCKRWGQIANNNVLWARWVKKYKCFAEYEDCIKAEASNEDEAPSFKNICLNVMRKQSEKTLLKYKQLLLTKTNSFTRQIDLKTLLSDANIIHFEAVFYDKSMNVVHSNTEYKLVPFDASSSLCWSNFDSLASMSETVKKQIESVRIYAKISLFLQITNNKSLKPFSSLSNSKSNTITKRTLILEHKFSLRSFESSSSNETLFTNSMIKLYLCDKTLMVALWNSDEAVKDVAFITFNLVYTTDLVQRLFSFDYETELEKLHKMQRKSNAKDLEIDTKFGLHDYFVYFCFRNQTNSVFLTHSVDIFKTRFDYCNSLKKKCLVLDIVNCDNQHDVGPQLKNLPKFFWNTEAFKKNSIDLLSLVDLFVQDSNKSTLISTSFPVFVKPNGTDANQVDPSFRNFESTFIAADSYFIEFSSTQFYINAQINCLKEEFTFSSNSESYHLANMRLWISLDFINEWFSTKFK